jgi:dTMP kinase
MNNSQKPGILIAIEGLDRSGKSTQIERVQAWLTEHNQSEGQETVVMKFPSKNSVNFGFSAKKPRNFNNRIDRESSTGKTIDAVLQGSKKLDKRALHLIFSANRWEQA